MAEGEPEVVEPFHGILACGTLGGRLIKDNTSFFFKISPPASTCVQAFAASAESEEDLTAREIEVLRKVAQGSRNRDIAEQLFIAEETVKVHMRRVINKLGARDRTQAVAIALRRGIPIGTAQAG